MALKRLATEKERAILRSLNKYKGKKVSKMTQVEKDDLLDIVAKKLKLI